MVPFFSSWKEEEQIHPIPPAPGKAEARLGEAKSQKLVHWPAEYSNEAKALHGENLLLQRKPKSNTLGWGTRPDNAVHIIANPACSCASSDAFFWLFLFLTEFIYFCFPLASVWVYIQEPCCSVFRRWNASRSLTLFPELLICHVCTWPHKWTAMFCK